MLEATADICGRKLSQGAYLLLLADLDCYSSTQVAYALTKCRKELRTFPTVSDIVSRIDDGHPGVEEAFAMLPKSEDDSVVWTPEMAEAHRALGSLPEEDPIAARMAFKEIYPKFVARAREFGRPAVWNVSLGHDTTNREAVVLDAHRKLRISDQQAQALLPGPAISSEGRSVLEGLGNLFKAVLKDADPKLISRHLARDYVAPTEEELEARRTMLREQAKNINNNAPT